MLCMEKIKSIYGEFTSFEGSLFKYSLSFSMLLALAPSLLLFAMLFRYAYLPIDMVLRFVVNFLPDINVDTLDQIFLFFTDKDYSIVSFIVTVCISFYLASRSIFSFLLISASQEGVDVPKWSIRIKSVVMFVALTVMLIAGVFLATQFHDLLPLISAGFMLLMFTCLYRALSFRKRSWSFGVIGGMFSTVCIMVLAELFVGIVHDFTSYKDIYGPIAALVTLLLAIYLISCIIYLGYCINIVCEDDYGNESRLPMKNEHFFQACIRLSDKVVRRFTRKK